MEVSGETVTGIGAREVMHVACEYRRIGIERDMRVNRGIDVKRGLKRSALRGNVSNSK